MSLNSTMEERIERIGDILARAIRLFLKNNVQNDKVVNKQKDLNIRTHLYPKQGMKSYGNQFKFVLKSYQNTYLNTQNK